MHALRGARVVVEPGRVLEQRHRRAARRRHRGGGRGRCRRPPTPGSGSSTVSPIYAGLIEPYAVRTRPGTDSGTAPARARRRRGQATPTRLVRPEHSVTPYAADEEAARKLREAGFTTALVAPAEGIFRGTGALLNLGDGPAGRQPAARRLRPVRVVRHEPTAAIPGSLMGAVALFRQTLLDAAWYAAARRAYDSRPGQTRPRFDSSLAALAEVAAGDAPIVLETGDAVDTLRAARLVEELGLDGLAGRQRRGVQMAGADRRRRPAPPAAGRLSRRRRRCRTRTT